MQAYSNALGCIIHVSSGSSQCIVKFSVAA